MTHTYSPPAIKLYQGPASEPITKAEVKLLAGYDSDLTAHDDLLDQVLIPAAREECELLTGRRLIEQTWDLVMDAFPTAEIDLRPLSPVSAVSSVTYLDAAGAQQTLDANTYVLDVNDSTRPFLLLAEGQSWPATYDTANAVVVRVIVGYGNAATDVPKAARAWMLMRAASHIPQSGIEWRPDFARLLDPIRIWSV